MVNLIKGRRFQLWEYHVSHGSLLVRSPASPGVETSVDIICVGVEYIAAPRHLGEITISSASPAEMERLETTLQKKLSPSRVWVLENSNGRFFIVGVSLKIRKHHGNIFATAFA